MVRAILSHAHSVLRAEDRRLFEEGTGQSFNTLWTALESDGSLATRVLANTAKFVHSRLNDLGLHALRALIAERAHHMRRARYAASVGTPEMMADADALEQKGILIYGPVNLSSSEDRRALLRKMRLAAADSSLKLPCGRSNSHHRKTAGACDDPSCCDELSWLDAIPTVHKLSDEQYNMHTDTFQPTYKLFIYPRGTKLDDGPFHYSPGSHRASAAKLRWLHAASKGPASLFAMCDSPRTYYGQREMAALGHHQLAPVPVPPWYAVIADTSGFHARGYATPGTVRKMLTPAWKSTFYSIPRALTAPFQPRDRTSRSAI